MSEPAATLPVIRPCKESDASGLHAFAGSLPPLTMHTPYTYWSLCRFARATCFAAEQDGALVGMVTGLLSATRPITLFIWQLGVAPTWRGTGLSGRLLDRMAHAAREAGAERLEFTIGRNNASSRKAFGQLAQRLGSSVLDLGAATIPEPIVSDGHQEVLYRIPLSDGC